MTQINFAMWVFVGLLLVHPWIGNSKPSPSVPYEFVVFAEGEDEDKDGADDVEVVWQDKESKQSVACILELLADQDPEWKCVEHKEEEQPEQLGNPQ